MSTSFTLDISNFQDDDFDSTNSFSSIDAPLTPTPRRATESQDVPLSSIHPLSPVAPSFTLVDDVTNQSESITTTIADDPSAPDHQIEKPTSEAETENGWFGYKIVGDNVDGKIKPRFMRSDNPGNFITFISMGYETGLIFHIYLKLLPLLIQMLP